MPMSHGYVLNAPELAAAAAILANGAVNHKAPRTARTLAFWEFFDLLCAEESQRDRQRTHKNQPNSGG